MAAGEIELSSKIDRELQKIDSTFAQKAGQYSTLHRRLDDLLNRMDADYQKCGDSPPDVPGWAPAVEAVATIPTSHDPNVKKVLEGIQGSMQDAGRKALKNYREETSKRHGLLNRMRPDWKELRGIMSRMSDMIAKAVQTTSKMDRYVDEYAQIVKDRNQAAKTVSYSAFKPFIISLLVMGIAFGGAFINFQLIALPMSELVPAGARIGGLPVSTVSALVIVLMEVAVGIFLMDMLGITDLFPKLHAVAPSRRTLILWLAVLGLFFLASVESSLAILREHIVEAENSLKMALSGSEASAMERATSSNIPVIGQAVLGFVLPWILAMVAIPLEMFLDSGRHVVASLGVLMLQALGHLMNVGSHLAKHLTTAIPGIYDVYVAIPLRIERMMKKSEASPSRARMRDAEVA
jgi:hypothetical protein